MLMLSFLVQPLHQAYANEPEESPPPPVELPPPEPEEPPPKQSPPDPEPPPPAPTEPNEKPAAAEPLSGDNLSTSDEEQGSSATDSQDNQVEASEDTTAVPSNEAPPEETASSTEPAVDSNQLPEGGDDSSASVTASSTDFSADSSTSSAETESDSATSTTLVASSTPPTDVTATTSTTTTATAGGGATGGSDATSNDGNSSSSDDRPAATSTDTVVATSTESEPTDSPGDTTETNPEPDPGADIGTTDSTDDPPEGPSSATTTATSTATSTFATSTDGAVEVRYVYQNSDAEHAFSDQECIAVGDGSFYCSSAVEEQEYLADEIFAAPDSDGDKEIYIRIRGVETKITDNQVDDLSPTYDTVSHTMAWHRMINDRFQIIVFDYETGEERQLTAGVHNNMEPSVSGELVAWQSWDGHDWEVMLYDGTTTQKLSNNELPDINPYVSNDYVMWNTIHNGGEKAVVLYDITTGATEVIDDTDGAAIKNPRFILMYDAEYDNGDVVTRGVDIRSGEVIPLSATPYELPSEIPPVDETGETRALINGKVSTRDSEDTKELEPKDSNTGSSTPDVPDAAFETLDLSASTTATETSVATESLVIDTLDLSNATPTTTESEPVAVITEEHELVIPPPATSTDKEVR